MKIENLKKVNDLCNEIEKLKGHREALNAHIEADELLRLTLTSSGHLHTFYFQDNILMDEEPTSLDSFIQNYMDLIDARIGRHQNELEDL